MSSYYRVNKIKYPFHAISVHWRVPGPPKITNWFFVPLCFFTFYTASQNLVQNGGFDLQTRCPNRISQLRLATGWLSSGSADLFCTCSPSRSAVYAGQSFVGSLQPYNGNCYSGFIVNPRYKEYITCELPKKLRKRKTYCIRFLYARSAFSALKVNSLGIYLHYDMHNNALRGQPMYKKTVAVPIADHPGVWTALSFTFSCQGGERFITIGSFGNDLEKAEHLPWKENRKKTRVFNHETSGYYFIDAVELAQLHRGETCLPLLLAPDTVESKPVIAQQTLEIVDTSYVINTSEPFVLQQLNFETAKSDILPSSHEELDELADYLLSQPELNLRISGHTDNRGNEKTNLKLSAARAQSVADYLVSKGVLPERLTCKGFGQSRPLADNATEEGRAKNRRVEFLLN